MRGKRCLTCVFRKHRRAKVGSNSTERPCVTLANSNRAKWMRSWLVTEGLHICQRTSSTAKILHCVLHDNRRISRASAVCAQAAGRAMAALRALAKRLDPSQCPASLLPQGLESLSLFHRSFSCCLGCSQVSAKPSRQCHVHSVHCLGSSAWQPWTARRHSVNVRADGVRSWSYCSLPRGQSHAGSQDLPSQLFKAVVLCSIMITCYMNAGGIRGIYGSVHGMLPSLHDGTLSACHQAAGSSLPVLSTDQAEAGQYLCL